MKVMKSQRAGIREVMKEVWEKVIPVTGQIKR